MATRTTALAVLAMCAEHWQRELSPALQDLYVMGWDDVSDEVLQMPHLLNVVAGLLLVILLLIGMG